MWKHEALLRKRAEEMNEVKSRAKSVRIATTKWTVIVSEDLEDLPSPLAIEESYSSDDGNDEDYEGAITCEDTCDWLSDMKRIDKQKMAMMLYDDYVEQMGLQKTEAAKEVGLFLGVSDKMVRLWRREFCAIVERKACAIPDII